MAAFEYRASDRSGSMQQGVESATDLQSAARALRARGLTPIVLKPAGGASRAAPASRSAGSTGKGLSLPGFGAKTDRVTPEQVLRFTSELGILLQAGLPLDRAMKVQMDTAPFGANRAMMEDILATLKSGRSLTAGLENHDSVLAASTSAWSAQVRQAVTSQGCSWNWRATLNAAVQCDRPSYRPWCTRPFSRW